jgi:hypothetical protein
VAGRASLPHRYEGRQARLTNPVWPLNSIVRRQMPSTREDMVRALKARTIPVLRAADFKGSFPHFYRDRAGHVDLLTFQFSQSGGRFVVEIAYVTPSRENLPEFLYDTPTSKLKAYFTGDRLRLGREGTYERWFIYDQPFAQYGEAAKSPDALALLAGHLIQTEGEDWWSSKRMRSEVGV